MQLSLANFEPKEKTNLGIPISYVGELNDDQSLAMLYSAVNVMVVPSIMKHFVKQHKKLKVVGYLLWLLTAAD